MISSSRRSSGGLWGRADLQGAADRPSTYYLHAARRARSEKQPFVLRSDATLMIEIQRDGSRRTSASTGARKDLAATGSGGDRDARCTVARLMRRFGLAGVVRGRSVRTTIPVPGRCCPLDRVNRQFKAPRPNALWVQRLYLRGDVVGFVYVAFVFDVFARRIVGWRASRRATRELRTRCPRTGPARAKSRPGQRTGATTRTAARNTWLCGILSDGWSGDRAVGRQRRRQLRQRPWRKTINGLSRRR